MKELNEIVDKVKGVDDGINNLIVPLLKDTIADSNRHNKRLFILNILLTVCILIIAIFSQILVMKQNEKYAEFLSQFEFESDVIQELNADDYSNSTIYDGITSSK